MDLKEKIKNIDTNLLEKKVEKLEVKKFKELNYGDYFIYYDYYKIYNIYIKIDGNEGDAVNAITGKRVFIYVDEDVIKIFYKNKTKIENIPYGSYFKHDEKIYIKTRQEEQRIDIYHCCATNIEDGSQSAFSDEFEVEPVNIRILTE